MLDYLIDTLGIVWIAMIVFAVIDDAAGRIDKKFAGKAAGPAPVKPQVVESPSEVEQVINEVLAVAEPVIAKYKVANKSAEPTAAVRVVKINEPRYTKEMIDGMNTSDLRSACSVEGIKWRNVYGKGQHLNVADMRQALLEV